MRRITNKRPLLTLLCALILCGLFLGGTALAVGQETIDWWVMAGGGGPVTGGAYTLDGTFSQAVIGQDSAGDRDLCAGFWCDRSAGRTYLPLQSSD